MFFILSDFFLSIYVENKSDFNSLSENGNKNFRIGTKNYGR